MLLDIGSTSGKPQDRLVFAVEILQFSTEYSVVAQDSEGRILFWNEGARRLYGHESAAVLGNSWEILFTPDDLSGRLPQAMRDTALLHGKWEGVVAGLRADGDRVMAHAVLTPHLDSSGETIGALLISRDISREVTVAQAVEGLLEAAPDAMMVADLNGIILLANSQTEKLFGYSRDELRGMPVELLVPDVFAPQKAPESFGVTRDHRRFPVEISLSPLESDGQRYLISAVRDVSFRKKAEAKFRGLLESAPEAMVIVDGEGRIVLVNSRVERLFGYPRAAILGKTLDLLIPARYRNTEDLFGRRADGSEFPVELSHSPIETEDGVLVSSSIRDVTERKRFERTLQEKNLELANTNQALASASQAKDRFLTSMSHELRTPLNAIIGFTGTLLMKLPGPLLPDQEKHLRTVQASGRHLLSLINDLLDLAKLESGKLEVYQESVFCLGVVEEAVASLRPAADAKSLSLTASVEPSGLSVLADRRSLTQILLNLAGNAVKFTERGGVAISVIRHADPARRLVAFHVSDTGAGIAPEDQAKLFQPFSQVNTLGRARREGTGLGLHLSRKLAEVLGGEIRLESEPGKGSTFTLLLEEA
jgi:PAS domain S-box-containing protein